MEFIYKGRIGVVYLEQTSGRVIPFGNEEVPQTFEKPLKKSDYKTDISGMPSGSRSVLIDLEGEMYKLKGIIPSNKGYEEVDVPFGCLKTTACERELRATQVMYKFGLKHGVKTPMRPVGYFQYDIIFHDEHVACCIQNVEGDDRFIDFFDSFHFCLEELYKRDLRSRSKIDEVREQLTNRIGNWVGYWYGALERANLCWGSIFHKPRGLETNVGSHNMVVYPVNRGIGIGLVDLDKSHRLTKKTKEYELNRIKKILSKYDGMLYFLEKGRELSSLKLYFIRQDWLSYGIPPFKKGVDPFKGIPCPDEEEMEIIQHFENGRKGIQPLPIDKKFFTNTQEKFMSMFKN